jgi:hypothetical protein
MRKTVIMIAGIAALSLSACAREEEDIVSAPPPLPPGALPGTIAADRDGDGIVDGYYTADGTYYANHAPAAPPPPPRPTRRGERG